MAQSLSGVLDVARDVGELANAAGEASQQVPGLRSAIKGFCRIAAGTPGFAVLEGLDIGNICTPYLSEDGRSFGGPAPPPFTGGQCDTNYVITVNYTPAPFQSAPPAMLGRPGPVTSIVPVITFEDGEDSIWGLEITAAGTTTTTTGFTQDPGSFTYVLTRSDGLPDDCGDPPTQYEPGDGYDGETFGSPQNITGPDGRGYDIVVSPPGSDGGGGLSIPVTVDGIEFNIGNSSADDTAPTPETDYTNPSPNNSPGPGGDIDGNDNPPDGIDANRLVSAVTITVTQEPLNASREVGGGENVFIPGARFDAGWFRWKVAGGATKLERITNRSHHVIFSPGVCANADGYEVKFSPGFSGFTTEYICTQEQQ